MTEKEKVITEVVAGVITLGILYVLIVKLNLKGEENNG